MASSVQRYDNSLKILRNNRVVKIFDDGLIVGFGAGDITYQIRGEL